MPVQVIPFWERGCWNFVAEFTTGVNVGRLSVRRYDGYVEVHELFVVPNVRQLNIGNALLKAITRYADVEKIELRVTVRQIRTSDGGEIPTMPELIRLFRSHGFKSYTDHPEVMKRQPSTSARRK